jgi:carotenoid cleavage dioxygenase-like enzyme
VSNALAPVDPGTIPQLSGRFEPVHTEISVDNLPVEGTLPRDLVGTYIRNGPNPRFTPLGSYTFPLEGDGMLHGIFLEDGRARYANRWVRTKGMAAEEGAGKGIFGGLMTPAFVDMALLGPDPDPGWPFRLDPFVSIVRHGGRYLALDEGLPPYEVTAELETVGLYDYDGALPGMCAHPKTDPVTGEMVLFRYDVEEPFLMWMVIGPDGTVTRPPTAVPGVDKCFMIHDFTITEHYVVLLIGPAVLDLDAMMAGGSVLDWRPELGTRIAVIDRHGSRQPAWIDTDAFWVWHFANAYETGAEGDRRIVLDFPWWSRLPMGGGEPITGYFARATVDPSRRSVDLTTVEQRATEFPRIDDRLTGLPHRYLTTTANAGAYDLIPGEHDQLIRLDMASGKAETYDCGAAIGEVVFAPRAGATEELDGYYLTFASSVDASRSAHFLVWDAADFPAPPMAKVPIPQRVPNGLHGNWFAAT